MSKVQLLLDVVDNMRALADSIQSVANTMAGNEVDRSFPEEQKVPEPIPSGKKPAKTVSLPEVRAVLGKLSHDGYTDQIRELIQKYGADRLGDVDPRYYAELLAEAEGLPNAAK